MAPSTSRDVASINSHPISDLYASYGNTLGQPPWLVSPKTQVESQLTVSYCTTLQGNLLRSLCQKTIVLQPVYVTALCGCQVIVEWRSTRYSNPSGCASRPRGTGACRLCMLSSFTESHTDFDHLCSRQRRATSLHRQMGCICPRSHLVKTYPPSEELLA